MANHTSTTRMITPAIARDFRTKYLFPNQRPLRKNHLKMLRDAMERGSFESGAAIRLAVCDKRLFLIDANHRMEALGQMPEGYAVKMPVTTTYCDSLEEVALTYSRIDRGAGRSLPDALRGLGIYTDVPDVSVNQLNTIMACSPLIEANLSMLHVNGSSLESKDAVHRFEVMAPWMEAGRRFFAAVTQGTFDNAQFFKNRFVVAVGLATFADAPVKALAFWSGMAKDSGLDSDDPRKRCLEFLRKYHGRGVRGVYKNGRGELFTPEYRSYYVAACWNAFIRGNKTVKMSVTAEGPIHLLSTRFDRTPKQPPNERVVKRARDLLTDLAEIEGVAA